MGVNVGRDVVLSREVCDGPDVGCGGDGDGRGVGLPVGEGREGAVQSVANGGTLGVGGNGQGNGGIVESPVQAEIGVFDYAR